VRPYTTVTFTTFTYAQFTLPNWAFSALLLISISTGIMATAAYRQLSVRVSLSGSFIAAVVANSLFGLGRLFVFYSWSGGVEKEHAPVAALMVGHTAQLHTGVQHLTALAFRALPHLKLKLF